MKEQNEHCRKISYKKVGYDLKLVIIDQIQNAQISIMHNVTGLNPITKEQIGNHGGIPDVVVLTLQTQKEPHIEWGPVEFSNRPL